MRKKYDCPRTEMGVKEEVRGELHQRVTAIDTECDWPLNLLKFIFQVMYIFVHEFPFVLFFVPSTSISALAGYENNSESPLKVTVKSISIGKTQQNKNPYQPIHYLIMSSYMVSFPHFCSLFIFENKMACIYRLFKV